MSLWSFQILNFLFMMPFWHKQFNQKLAYSKCFWSLLCSLLFTTHKNILWILLPIILLLLLNCIKKRKRQLWACTEWKQCMWHSDRNNNNTLTEQPTFGGWKLSNTHNIQQQWQSTKAGIQFEQQWLQLWQQNLWTERWQMMASMDSWIPEFSRNSKRANKTL